MKDHMGNLLVQDLLLMMSQQNKNRVEAKDAFDEFYKRYYERLTTICIYVCKFRGKPELAKDVCQETLTTVYMKADKFDSDYGTRNSSIEFRLFAWVRGIAVNELRRLLRSMLPVGDYKFSDDPETNWGLDQLPDPDTKMDDVYEASEESLSIQILRQELIMEAINSLPNREREVLLTYFKYAPYHVSSKDLKGLASKFEVTHVYLRKIKERALQQVRRYMLDKLQ